MATTIISERITINPEICNGKPVIRGKRITARTILEYLSAGDSPQDILEQYPSLEIEDIQAVLAFAVKLVDREFVIRPTAA